MISSALAVASGLAAGSAHVVTGPDHLAAVLPLSVGGWRRAAGVGALWGVGHGFGVVVMGALGAALAGFLDLAALSWGSELAVGILLVVLGAWTVRRSRLVRAHSHAHEHDEDDHAHFHVHIGDRTVDAPEHVQNGEHRTHRHSAVGFGVLHGVAGGGHLFGVLPSLALPPAMAALYLAAYFLGAVAAMTLFAALVGRLTRTPRRLPRVLQGAGALSILVGLVWVGQAIAGF